MRSTVRGTIDAAGPSTSKRKRAQHYWCSSGAQLRLCDRHLGVAGPHTAGNESPVGPHSANRGSLGFMALRTAGQPERTELSCPMLKTTDRDRGG